MEDDVIADGPRDLDEPPVQRDHTAARTASPTRALVADAHAADPVLQAVGERQLLGPPRQCCRRGLPERLVHLGSQVRRGEVDREFHPWQPGDGGRIAISGPDLQFRFFASDQDGSSGTQRSRCARAAEMFLQPFGQPDIVLRHETLRLGERPAPRDRAARRSVATEQQPVPLRARMSCIDDDQRSRGEQELLAVRLGGVRGGDGRHGSFRSGPERAEEVELAVVAHGFSRAGSGRTRIRGRGGH